MEPLSHFLGDEASVPIFRQWSLCPAYLEGDGASGRLLSCRQHIVLGGPIFTGDEDDAALLATGLDQAKEVRHARIDTEEHHHLQQMGEDVSAVGTDKREV